MNALDLEPIIYRINSQLDLIQMADSHGAVPATSCSGADAEPTPLEFLLKQAASMGIYPNKDWVKHVHALLLERCLSNLYLVQGFFDCPNFYRKYIPNSGQDNCELNFDEMPSNPTSLSPADLEKPSASSSYSCSHEAPPADVGSVKVDPYLESELLWQEHGPVKESNAEEDSHVKGELFGSAPPWKRARDEPQHEATVREESHEVDEELLKMAEEWSAEIWHKHYTRFRWWDPWLQESVFVFPIPVKSIC